MKQRPEQQPRPDAGDARERRFARDALTLGTTLVVGMVLFSLGGYWIDRRRGGGIAFTIVGMCLGLAYGAYEVWRVIRILDGGSSSGTSGGQARRMDPDPRAGHDEDQQS